MAKYVTRILTAGMAMCMLLALSVEGQAQYRRGNRGRGYAKAGVERTIRRLENASDRFVRTFDSERACAGT